MLPPPSQRYLSMPRQQRQRQWPNRRGEGEGATYLWMMPTPRSYLGADGNPVAAGFDEGADGEGGEAGAAADVVAADAAPEVGLDDQAAAAPQ